MIRQLVFTLWAATLARGQEARPAFDAASVTPWKGAPPSTGYRHQINPGGLTMLHVSLGYCIRLAWDVKTGYELIGPGWINPPTEVLIDITARTGRPATEDEIRLMLQTLLIERFKLAIHREKRELPVYELLKVRDDRALRRSAAPGDPKMKPGQAPYSDVFQNVTMAQLAQRLGPPLTSRPVIDRTGLDGAFDFELDFGPYVLDSAGKPILDARGAIDSEGAALQAVRDQLGLALKSARAPFDVLVIDRVERTPTGN